MASRVRHDPVYRRLCARLRGWREGAGFTQRGLAAALGKPHSYGYKTETGNRRNRGFDPVEFVRWYRACEVGGRGAMGAVENGDPRNRDPRKGKG